MDSLGDRMKGYEKLTDTKLLPRTPIGIRIDGKNFHSFTKKMKFEKPFDEMMTARMAATTLGLCKFAQDCLIGYTQSDEITLILAPEATIDSQAWFGRRVQKLCSLLAAKASVIFNNSFYYEKVAEVRPEPIFDCRVFALPNMVEAYNCLVWRQNDCVKNSISSACYYDLGKKVGRGTARKLVHGKNQKEQQEALFQKAGINWNDYPPKWKRGVACVRGMKIVTGPPDENGDVDCTVRRPWVIKEEIPRFTSPEGKDWLGRLFGIVWEENERAG